MNINWIEQYLFFPTLFQRLIGVFFFPVTVFYCIVTAYKRLSAKPQYFGIPVVSIGNLVLGGTGKTPVTIALTKDKKNIAVILRGYGRSSTGLYVVSKKGKILEDVDISGDEAMEYAISLPNATVIVSQNREEGIKKAKELGCKVVYLDDGYSKHNIVKYNLLIRPKIEPTNIFCLPSGGYRETPMMYSFANCVIKEGSDFHRIVTFKDKQNNTIDILPKNIVVLTAISKSYRLKEFLNDDIDIVSYPDHHSFVQKNIDELHKKYPDYIVVTTKKDMVKLEKFAIKDIIVMDLEIKIDQNIIDKIDKYILK